MIIIFLIQAEVAVPFQKWTLAFSLEYQKGLYPKCHFHDLLGQPFFNVPTFCVHGKFDRHGAGSLKFDLLNTRFLAVQV